MRTSRPSFSLALIATGAIALAACGGGDDDSTSAVTDAQPDSAGADDTVASDPGDDPSPDEAATTDAPAATATPTPTEAPRTETESQPDRSSTPSASPGSSAETFTGEIPLDRPAVRAVEMQAGDALRLFVVPTGEVDEDDDDGMSVAIGLDANTAYAWADFTSLYYSDYGDIDDYFSDEQFFSDFSDGYASSATTDFILERTGYYPFSFEYGQLAAPYYFGFGRGWGSAAPNGTWIQFIAPGDAAYQILISGRGEFEVTLEQQGLPPQLAAELNGQGGENDFDQGPTITSPFKWGPDEFTEVLAAQLDFLFDDEFFPIENFFSDDAGERPYGPNAEARAAVEEFFGL